MKSLLKSWLSRRELRTSSGAMASKAGEALEPEGGSANRAASASDARSAQAHFQAGLASLQRSELDGAMHHFQNAVDCDPRHAHACANLGAVLRDLGKPHAAQPYLEAALDINPELAAAAYNLALIHIDRRDWQAAASLLSQSLRADRKQPDAQYWLGNALMGIGDAPQARKAYQAALRLNGGHIKARWGALMALLPAVALSAEEQSDAAAAFERELDKVKTWLVNLRAPNAHEVVGAQQPYYLAYIPRNHREALGKYGDLCASLMGDWARRAGVPRPVALAGQRLRVGIISAHIYNHSVWNAIVRGWVEHLDPRQFELHLFHTGASRDSETEWASRRVKRLHHGLGGWTSWAKAISDGQFDVLIYPEIGMDATTVRLSALRLAQRQWASWGHPVTTGLPTIDAYISADAFEPAGAERHYTEKLIRLPRLGCVYRPYQTRVREVDLARWDIPASDHILVCAGTPFKYAPADDQILIEVARRCRPCKLVFFRPEDDHKATLLEQRLRQAFAAAGLEFSECVRFIPWLPQDQFFWLLQHARVYLDSVGFSGFNTAMQAVECDTPVVAWEGEFMRGRFASGILRELGLSQWIARTAQEFATHVETLCRDAEKNRQVRQIIRGNKHKLFQDSAVVEGLAAQLRAPVTSV